MANARRAETVEDIACGRAGFTNGTITDVSKQQSALLSATGVPAMRRKRRGFAGLPAHEWVHGIRAVAFCLRNAGLLHTFGITPNRMA